MRVGVVFGGRSVEHDVSIITALQVMEALSVRHSVVPVYITRSGRWLSGEALRDIGVYETTGEPDAPEVSCDLSGGRIRSTEARRGIMSRKQEDAVVDVVLPATHGTYGEDGSLQGLLELCGVPYAGSGVAASAVAMDKTLTKAVLKQHGLPTPESAGILREHWSENANMVSPVLEAFGLPVYVKPASLGSSIGVSRCTSREEVDEALGLAFELDGSAVVEPSVENAIEVNCSVIGAPGRAARASVCEQVSPESDLLSFEDKYLRGGKAEGMKGAERIIPAPIGDDRTEQVQELARRSFEALRCGGVARVDFLIAPDGTVLVNELNTIPGSFSFYLWEPAGLAFPDMLDELLDLALEQNRSARSTTRTFESALLAGRSAGAKSAG